MNSEITDAKLVEEGPLKKGPWTTEEDTILSAYVIKHGEGNWNLVQRNTGLRRCGKSCRLRWANHLRPDLKKGSFSKEEEALIIYLHSQMGNKWARMAAQLPGRTDNEIKNFWNTRIKRKMKAGIPLTSSDNSFNACVRFPWFHTLNNENALINSTGILNHGISTSLKDQRFPLSKNETGQSFLSNSVNLSKNAMSMNCKSAFPCDISLSKSTQMRFEIQSASDSRKLKFMVQPSTNNSGLKQSQYLNVPVAQENDRFIKRMKLDNDINHDSESSISSAGIRETVGVKTETYMPSFQIHTQKHLESNDPTLHFVRGNSMDSSISQLKIPDCVTNRRSQITDASNTDSLFDSLLKEGEMVEDNLTSLLDNAAETEVGVSLSDLNSSPMFEKLSMDTLIYQTSHVGSVNGFQSIPDLRSRNLNSFFT